MTEYTYKDIIIDPASEEAKNAIGKEAYYSENPTECLEYANNDDKYHLGRFNSIENYNCPFNFGDFNYSCLIVKKEEPKPKHVQFQDGREFFNSYLSVESRLEKEDYFLSNHGIWLMDCENGDYFLVTEIWGDGVVIGSNQFTTSWNDLSNDYTFLDGTPCGKEVEDE